MSRGPQPPGRWPENEPESGGDDTVAEVFNRFSLDSGRRRRRRRSEPRPAESAPATPDRAEEAPEPSSWPAAEPADFAGTRYSAAPEPEPESEPFVPPAAQEEEHATHIRAYAWTGGRTRSNFKLELETLVSTSEHCRTARLERLEHQSIAEHCQHPRSVAEVGALLSVPLGVAKVLLGDMADLGLITVHNTVTETGSASHLKLMERVLSGLRRL